MDAADLLPGEQVTVVDVTNGARLETYVVEGGRGVLGVNGAAAHLVRPGDTVVLVSYGQLDAAEAAAHRPRVVFVDEHNRIVEPGARVPAEPDLPSGTEPAETEDAAMLDALLQPER
jgi:aspartate 1-decarboxylase